jgi:hypothetical protein
VFPQSQINFFIAFTIFYDTFRPTWSSPGYTHYTQNPQTVKLNNIIGTLHNLKLAKTEFLTAEIHTISKHISIK